MKRLLVSMVLLGALAAAPVTALAQISISIGIPLPPPIVFQAPPVVIVLPDTPDVYVVPDVDADLFFFDGWWWRFWDGYWYRSRYYDSGWVYFDRVPSFYYDVDPDWRSYYRRHEWHGHPWRWKRIPDRELQRNWSTWHRNGYWRGQRTWGVRGYRPRPPQEQQALRQQRQHQYQQRPEVRQHQYEQRPRVQQHQYQQRPEVQQHQYQQRPQVQQHQRVQPQPQRQLPPQEREFGRQGPPREERQPQFQRQGGESRPEEGQGGQFRGEERHGGGEHGRPEGRPGRGEEERR